MDKLADDETYAFFKVAAESSAHYPCQRYQKCEVVMTPFTEGLFPGGMDWLFPKRSPLLPIFNKYYWELKESGHFKITFDKPEYDPSHLLPDQECETLDGHPISMDKVISLFTMFFSTAFLCTMIFW